MKRYTLHLLSIFLISLTACADTPEAQVLELEIDPMRIEASAQGPLVSFADVLERTTPSVVAVYTSKIVSVVEQDQPRNLRELYERYYYPERFRQDPNAPTREEKQPLGVGSGVIFTKDGYVVTNNHVIRDQSNEIADEIKVSLGDGEEYLAEFVGADPKTDVAVLKIERDAPFSAVTIADSEQLRVGDIVFAIGNPLGVGLTATQGIVSATGRNSLGILGEDTYEDFIQTDAAINPGNSGGALIDAWGRLIGINTAIIGRSGNIGIGFAIPSRIVRNVMTNLIENGEVPRGLLGLYPRDLTRDLADAFGLESTKGALVNQVMPDSPAEKGGVLRGDIILKVDDKVIASAVELRLVVSQTLPGTEVILELIRDGETIELPVVLGSVSGKLYGSSGLPIGPTESDKLEGITLAAIDEDLRTEYKIPEEIEGLVVTEVSFDSEYANSFAVGMVVIEVNSKSVTNLAAFEENLAEGVNRLYTWIEGRIGYTSLRLK
jgi:serine protease Do/serine protease DegQ